MARIHAELLGLGGGSNGGDGGKNKHRRSRSRSRSRSKDRGRSSSSRYRSGSRSRSPAKAAKKQVIAGLEEIDDSINLEEYMKIPVKVTPPSSNSRVVVPKPIKTFTEVTLMNLISLP